MVNREINSLEITGFIIISCVALICIEYKVIFNFFHLRYYHFFATVIISSDDYGQYSHLMIQRLDEPTPECICRFQSALQCPSPDINAAFKINRSCLEFEIGDTYVTNDITINVMDQEFRTDKSKEKCEMPICYNNSVEFVVFCESSLDQNSLMGKFREPRAYAILLMSIPCLLVTGAVYLVIPGLRNLHGKALLCHLASQIIVYFEIAIVRLANFDLRENAELCTGLGVIFQFFFIACFAWLSVTSYDIWKIFEFKSRHMLPAQRRERRQFQINSAYAWGVPLSISIFSVVMNYIPCIPTKFKPHFADIGCRRQGNRFSLYVGLPVGVYLCLILMIFLATSYRLWTHDHSCSATDQNNKISFKVYLKLFLVMGLCWLVGILVAGYGGHPVMLMSDIFNISQGPAFFIIFICKQQVFQMLRKKFGSKDTLETSI